MNNKKLESTRDAYGKALVEIGNREDIVVVDADLSVSTKTSKFGECFPERFFNVGCAEQNLIATAAGLALGGKTVFASTHSQFFLRGWEVIRTIIAHDQLNVKLVGTHSGITNGVDGYTHHSIEDIALMRVIPDIIVENPADSVETMALIKKSAEIETPFFIRLSRTSTPVLFGEEYEYQLGKGVELVGGDDIVLVATGTMVSKALETARILKQEGISAGVVNIHTIKPLDTGLILELAKRIGNIVTIEEHSIIGGLGDAVGDVLHGHNKNKTKFKKMGIRDTFTESGSVEDLYETFGLTPNHIASTSKKMLREA